MGFVGFGGPRNNGTDSWMLSAGTFVCWLITDVQTGNRGQNHEGRPLHGSSLSWGCTSHICSRELQCGRSRQRGQWPCHGCLSLWLSLLASLSGPMWGRHQMGAGAGWCSTMFSSNISLHFWFCSSLVLENLILSYSNSEVRLDSKPMWWENMMPRLKQKACMWYTSMSRVFFA